MHAIELAHFIIATYPDTLSAMPHTVPTPPLLDTALRTVHTRLDKLNTESFISKLSLLQPEEYQRLFNQLPTVLHRYLFEGIFANERSRV
jgi:hypothetical protein